MPLDTAWHIRSLYFADSSRCQVSVVAQTSAEASRLSFASTNMHFAVIAGLSVSLSSGSSDSLTTTCSASGVVGGDCGYKECPSDCHDINCWDLANGDYTVTVHGESSSTCCQPLADEWIAVNITDYDPHPAPVPLPSECNLSNADAAIISYQVTLSVAGGGCAGDPCIIDDINSTYFRRYWGPYRKVTFFGITDACCSMKKRWYRDGAETFNFSSGFADCEFKQNGNYNYSEASFCEIDEYAPPSAQEVVAGDAAVAKVLV